MTAWDNLKILIKYDNVSEDRKKFDVGWFGFTWFR
jgi:hypothetical protein